MATRPIARQRRGVGRSARLLIGFLVAFGLPAGQLLLPATVAAASPTLTLTPNTGPPTTVTTVKGAGFGVSETVDVYFDTTDMVLASTNSTGGFSVGLTVPSTATPGTHWVTADGRASHLSAQAAFTVNTNWLSFRDGPRHSGVNPYENVLSPSTVGGLNQQWATTTGGPVFSSPAFANGNLYVGSEDNKVYRLNAATGAVVWSYTTGMSVLSSPAVNAGVGVYVGSEDFKVYALNPSTGAKLWSTATGSFVVSSPTYVNGVVYVGSEDDKVYALNASSGALKWSYPTSGIVKSSPAVANGVVYIGSADTFVYALNASSGALKWARSISNVSYPSPAVANGVVYVGEDDMNLYALDAGSGAVLWSATTGGAFISSPAVANGVVYVGNQDGSVYAYSLGVVLGPCRRICIRTTR
jgi:outer membrane protein assembly factor BamB